MPKQTQHAQPGEYRWLPALAGLLLLALTAVLWWTLTRKEQADLQQRANTAAANLASHLEADLGSRTQALQRIVKRWEIRGGTPEHEFLNDAGAYFADAAGYQSIAWVDRDFSLRWQVPGKNAALTPTADGPQRQALAKTRGGKTPFMTGPLDQSNGERAFQLYFPLYVQGEFQGFIMAAFHAPTWLNYVLQLSRSPESLGDFRVLVSMDGLPVFSQAGWDELRADGLSAATNAEIMGHRFSVDLKPTPGYLKKSKTVLPELVAVSGALLATLVSLLVHFYQRTIAEARKALAAKNELEAEIREHKKTEAQLAQERQRLANIIEGTNVGTWEWNVQTGETIFNERWAEMLGYSLAELAPVSIDTWIRFANPDDLAASDALLKKHFSGELPYYECEVRLRHKNGGWVWVLDRGRVASWGEKGKPLLMSGTHQDITDRKLAEERIQHLATHDALTGLPTLRLAKDHLDMAVHLANRQKNMAALLFIDLDGFKEVNDTLGHDAGDEVLKEVALRLLACARATDTVARLGGDEFLLIASGITDPGNAGEIAGKILAAVSQPIAVGEHLAGVGVSIGIALFPGDGEEADQLIKAADTAMYQVKNAGKNGFAFAGRSNSV